MTEEYIDAHYAEIVGHGSEIESRQDDSDCTIGSLKESNRKIIDGYWGSGEQVVLIDSDYEQAISRLLE